MDFSLSQRSNKMSDLTADLDPDKQSLGDRKGGRHVTQRTSNYGSIPLRASMYHLNTKAITDVSQGPA